MGTARFWGQCFRLAWRESLHVAGYSKGRALFSIAVALAGLGIHWRFYGRDQAMGELTMILIYGLAAFGAALLIFFLVNLLRAPAILYGAAQAALAEKAKETAPPDIVVHDTIHCVSRMLELAAEGEVAKPNAGNERATVFYLQISNGRLDGRTLRNLRGKILTFADMRPMVFSDGRESIDLQQGDLALLRIGYMITEPRAKPVNEWETVHPFDVKNFRRNADDGHHSLCIARDYSVGSRQGFEGMRLRVFVTADDVSGTRVEIEFNGSAENIQDVVTVTGR